MAEQETHRHLTWAGYALCDDPGCTKLRADPADDMRCTDPDCEGGCEAARHNAARRRHLDAAVIRGIERVTGERYENGQWVS